MNKDKRVTVRFTKKEYETLKNKSKAYGIENLSLYIRKKMLVDKDEYLSNASKIRKLYDHLAQLEMEFETIKNEAGLSEYDILGYEREFANIEEDLKNVKQSSSHTQCGCCEAAIILLEKMKGVVPCQLQKDGQ